MSENVCRMQRRARLSSRAGPSGARLTALNGAPGVAQHAPKCSARTLSRQTAVASRVAALGLVQLCRFAAAAARLAARQQRGEVGLWQPELVAYGVPAVP
jgi:hypothetical protein